MLKQNERLWIMRFVYYNISLPWSAKVDSTSIDYIKECENALKTHTHTQRLTKKNCRDNYFDDKL